MTSSEENNISDPCVICTKPFDHEEIKYALQCSTVECHFNMCTDCTEKLLESSKEGPQESSDGNVYTLNLQCPSCRGGFCVPLSDILLLRESERIKVQDNFPDEDFSAKELRTKYERLAQLSRAQKCYNKCVREMEKGNKGEVLASEDDCDEEAEEMQARKMEYIDSLLFYGLQGSMTVSERTYVKELMTSGSTTKLVQATHILSSIVEMNRNGGTPATRRLQNTNNSSRDWKKKSQSFVTSKKSPTSTARDFRRTRSATQVTAAIRMPMQETSAWQVDLANKHRWKKMYPAPSRMPRSFIINVDFDPNSYWGCPIKFVDDLTSLAMFRRRSNNSALSDTDRCHLIRDGFSSLQVNNFGKVLSKDNTYKEGVEYLLSGIKDYVRNEEQVNLRVPWRRLVVSSVKGHVARLGLKVGDIITHVDGEPFDGNSEKLKFILEGKKQSCGEDETPTCQIVVNADIGTAEALRLRSFMAENQIL